MPFFHVLVELKSEPKKLRCILSDLSEEELTEKFLRPYRQQQDIVCDRETIRFHQIRKLHVVRTEQRNATERNVLREQISQEIEKYNWHSDSVILFNVSRGNAPEDILRVGEDITTVIISGPLGRV